MNRIVIFLFVIYGTLVSADYPCVCSYNVEKGVYTTPAVEGQPIGYMYEFDCKPKADSKQGPFLAVMFENQVGYVETDEQVEEQTCPGEIPASDLVTTHAPVKTTTMSTEHTVTYLTTITTLPPTTTKPTTAKPTTTSTPKPTTTSTPKTTTTSTPKPTTTSTPKPTTTSTPKPTTTTMPTTKVTTTPTPTTASTTLTTTTSTTTTATPTTTTTTPTTTKPTPTTVTTTKSTTSATMLPTDVTTVTYQIPEGHTELCPEAVLRDNQIFDSYLGQYGDYCFEYVNVTTQWHNAKRHCTVAANGDLIHITSQEEQDYFLRFLSSHQVKDSVWIGLTDSVQEGAPAEGTWVWSSGEAVTFQNFGGEYNSQTDIGHKNNDCVIMKQGGEWVDVPCGVPLFIGTGFGENHKFICQYNVTSKPLDLFHVFAPAIVG